MANVAAAYNILPYYYWTIAYSCMLPSSSRYVWKITRKRIIRSSRLQSSGEVRSREIPLKSRSSASKAILIWRQGKQEAEEACHRNWNVNVNFKGLHFITLQTAFQLILKRPISKHWNKNTVFHTTLQSKWLGLKILTDIRVNFKAHFTCVARSPKQANPIKTKYFHNALH